ncbi:hypothetical protein HJD18_03215 [Thermoleophilia bacterium SCSIO 60948]|nr:hypothetical protein HJD18_03215 [Thermoleophilia bacterium SCSIO 60948]
MRAPGTARLALGFLCAQALLVGLTASFAPRVFYEDFPFVSSWVVLLPPFNEHLVTDVGGLYLAFAVLFAWATVRPSAALIQPLCAAWAVAAVLHLVFHVRNLESFGALDAAAEVVSLALVLALPAIAVVCVRPPRTS